MSPTEPQNQARHLVIPGCQDAADLRFAYLNLRNHPRGQLMLQELTAAGFVPAMVIDEESTLAASGRAGQLVELQQLTDFEDLVDTADFCASQGIPYHLVSNHNDAVVEHLLRGVELDLAVLGDTRVLKQHIIEAVPFGIVNVHPGLLPDVRGNHPYIWSIIHGLPQGVTAHLIDKDVDRGPILLTRPALLPPGTGLPQLIHLLNTMCASIIVDVLRQTVRGEAVATPQPQDARFTFRAARPEIRALAATILRERATKNVLADTTASA